MFDGERDDEGARVKTMCAMMRMTSMRTDGYDVDDWEAMRVYSTQQ